MRPHSLISGTTGSSATVLLVTLLVSMETAAFTGAPEVKGGNDSSEGEWVPHLAGNSGEKALSERLVSMGNILTVCGGGFASKSSRGGSAGFALVLLGGMGLVSVFISVSKPDNGLSFPFTSDTPDRGFGLTRGAGGGLLMFVLDCSRSTGERGRGAGVGLSTCGLTAAGAGLCMWDSCFVNAVGNDSLALVLECSRSTRERGRGFGAELSACGLRTAVAELCL